MQMNVKLLIAAVATVFISIVAGAVISSVANVTTQAQTAGDVSALTTSVATIASTATPIPAVTMRPVIDAEIVLQREATYQARLAEANKMLEEAATALVQSRFNERQIASQFNQVVAQSSPTAVVLQAEATPAPATDANTVSQVATEPQRMAPESALAIAVALDPAAQLLRAPELVMYDTAMAYEFVFDRGTIYINALDGMVMYNGIVVMQEAQRQAVAAQTTNAQPSHDDDERDDEHHHDDRGHDDDDKERDDD